MSSQFTIVIYKHININLSIKFENVLYYWYILYLGPRWTFGKNLRMIQS